jgi:LysM repeat protein/ribosomal protein S27AE
MSPETITSNNKVCPTCGTRLSENATRCLVCGRSFTPNVKTASVSPVKGPKLPELKLSLPAALGLIVLVLGLGAALIFFILQTTGRVTTPTATPTITVTPTSTSTPAPTIEPTAAPTATPLPPKEYIVKAGDYCSTIALIYKVSIQSIAELNQLPPDCGTLYENQKLYIPMPTPMPTSLPTATLSAAEATQQACGTVPYQVKEGDSLSSISLNYNISIDSIKNFNRLTSENVMVGMKLSLPLCERRPTQGPTPTATLPPPYPAASLLLPADGIVYTNLNDSIVLQWSSVGTFRENEAYAITVVDVTSGEEKKVVQYTSETKYIVPASMRPLDNTSHIFRWWVVAVRQSGTTSDGQPVYSTFGQISLFRVFGWSGSSGAVLPTP